MSFWSFWSRRSPAGAPPIAAAPIATPPRRPFAEADRAYVRSALDRFEATGLHIHPDLNPDLIVVRALIDIDLWKPDHRDLGEEDLQSLFLVLAGETDSLTWYVDDVQELFPALSSMEDEAADMLLREQSQPIFVNAASICTVNENSLDEIVIDFCVLADITFTQFNQRVMQVDGLGKCQFAIEDRKRPDIPPLFTEMNRIAKAKGIGRFISVPEGSSESETFIFATETALPGIIDLLRLDPRTASRV